MDAAYTLPATRHDNILTSLSIKDRLVLNIFVSMVEFKVVGQYLLNEWLILGYSIPSKVQVRSIFITLNLQGAFFLVLSFSCPRLLGTIDRQSFGLPSTKPALKETNG